MPDTSGNHQCRRQNLRPADVHPRNLPTKVHLPRYPTARPGSNLTAAAGSNPKKGGSTADTSYAEGVFGFQMSRTRTSGNFRELPLRHLRTALRDGQFWGHRRASRRHAHEDLIAPWAIVRMKFRLTIVDAERLCDRLDAKLGFSREGWTALAARSMRDERPQPGDRTAH